MSAVCSQCDCQRVQVMSECWQVLELAHPVPLHTRSSWHEYSYSDDNTYIPSTSGMSCQLFALNVIVRESKWCQSVDKYWSWLILYHCTPGLADMNTVTLMIIHIFLVLVGCHVSCLLSMCLSESSIYVRVLTSIGAGSSCNTAHPV